MMQIRLFILFFLFGLQAGAQQISWSEVAPGVWKGIAGLPENYNLLTASGALPRTEGLKKLGSSSFPLAQTDIQAAQIDGKTSLRFPLQREEQIRNFKFLYVWPPKTLSGRSRLNRQK